MDPHIRSARVRYESDEDFAMALLAEGAQMLDTILFSEGTLMNYIIIAPDEDLHGYHVLVYDKEGDDEQDSEN